MTRLLVASVALMCVALLIGAQTSGALDRPVVTARDELPAWVLR